MTTYRSKDTVEAVLWDGDTSTANDFLGDRYGTDWEYLVGDVKGRIRFGPYLQLTCVVGQYLVRYPTGLLGRVDGAYFEKAYHPHPDPDPPRRRLFQESSSEPTDPLTGQTFAEWRAKFEAMRDAEHALSDAYVRLRTKLGALHIPNTFLSNGVEPVEWAWTEHQLDELIRVKGDALDDVAMLEERLSVTLRDIADLEEGVRKYRDLYERSGGVQLQEAMETEPPPARSYPKAVPFEQKADDPINHPSHYTSHPSGIEHIQVTEHMNFCLGNAIKYIWRAGSKEGVTAVEDLRKAVWYINREIARLEG